MDSLKNPLALSVNSYHKKIQTRINPEKYLNVIDYIPSKLENSNVMTNVLYIPGKRTGQRARKPVSIFNKL